MFLISDGRHTVVSGTYPFPYGILPAIRLHESGRRFATALPLIILNSVLCVAFLILLAINPEATGITAYSIGFPCMAIWLKYLSQKMITLKEENIKIVGIAPKRIWVEHLASCAALALAAVWAIRFQGNDVLWPAFFYSIILTAIIAAAWPFINLRLYRHKISQAE
jgi:hypothetical protein